jgi:hypothetical protein
MLTHEQKQERLEMIARVANRFNKMKSIKENSKKALKAAQKPLRKKAPKLDRLEIKEDGDNLSVWEDADTYARNHYGANYVETTRYDNEWN